MGFGGYGALNGRSSSLQLDLGNDLLGQLNQFAIEGKFAFGLSNCGEVDGKSQGGVGEIERDDLAGGNKGAVEFKKGGGEEDVVSHEKHTLNITDAVNGDEILLELLKNRI